MDKTKDNVAATAIDWNYKLYRINQSFARLADDKKLSVKYEDLLENPGDTVQNICTFVGVEYEPQMLEYHKTSDRYIGKHHSELIFKSIDSSNINKWKKNLSSSELRAFELISGFNLKRYGYAVTGERNILLDPIYIAYKLVFGIPYRIYQVILNKTVNELAFRRGAESTVDAAKMPNSNQK